MLMIGDDLRAAGRVFMKEPMFAATLVATLALGIGAATALATIANAILVRPLPMPDSGRIHVVQIETQAAPSPDDWFPLSDADFLAWQSQSRTLDVAAFASNKFTLTGRGDPEPLSGVTVTTRFFDVVGIRPAVGRAFEASDTAPVAILSDEVWSRLFGRDPAIVGKGITLNGWQGTVIGVMPPGFSYPRQRTDVWAHLRMSPPARRGPFYLTGVGRLRDGAMLAETAAELERTSAALKAQFGGEMNWKLAIESLKEQTIRPARAGLYMLLSAVGCLLLIAATNSANLSLVRGIRRHREIAVRTALGASRWRVARQLVIESVAFAGFAGVIGLGIAAAIVAVVRVTAADTLPRLAEVRIDAGAFAIAAGLSLMTGLLFGVLPSWLSSRSDPADALRQLGRPGADSGRRPWAQRLVVSFELALAIVLASSGGLMIRSFVNLQRTNVGIQPDGVLTFMVEIPSSQYPRGPKRADFYERLLDGLSRVPGVEAAGLGVSLPPEDLFVTDNYTVAGFEVPAGESAPVGPIVVATDKYFDALRIPLLQGRLFQPSDTATSDRVVIVSHAIARKYFPAGDAIGRRFRTGGPERPNNPWMTIVGVVGDVKFDGLARDPSEAYYLPLAQELWNGMFAVLRTSGDPAAVMPGVRSAVREVDAAAAAPRRDDDDGADGGCLGTTAIPYVDRSGVGRHGHAPRRVRDLQRRLVSGGSTGTRVRCPRSARREGRPPACAGTAGGPCPCRDRHGPRHRRCARLDAPVFDAPLRRDPDRSDHLRRIDRGLRGGHHRRVRPSGLAGRTHQSASRAEGSGVRELFLQSNAMPVNTKAARLAPV